MRIPRDQTNGIARLCELSDSLYTCGLGTLPARLGLKKPRSYRAAYAVSSTAIGCGLGINLPPKTRHVSEAPYFNIKDK
jgi:hypothetical protein